MNKRTILLFISTIALIQFLAHILTNGNYGMFRDEYYYIECAKNLAWGYVDQPPLSILLLKIWMFFFGESLFAIRLLPALGGSALIFFTAFICREMGGKGFAQILAALTAAVTPGFLAISGFFSMNIFDLLFWAALVLVAIRAIKLKKPELWLLFGVLAGLGLMNKISILYFGLAFVVALLFSPYRKQLLNKYLWLGGAAAVLIFLPYIFWQISNGWPTLEFMHNARLYKNASFTLSEFFSAQVLEIGPPNIIIWLTGLIALFFYKSLRPFRMWAGFYIFLFIFLFLQKGKPYYLYSAYPVLFAAGAVWWEQISSRAKLRWLAPVLVVNALVGLVITAPLALPLLPPQQLVAYMDKTGIQPQNAENSTLGQLPQHFADRFGWEQMAKEVSAIYSALPSEQQSGCVVVTENYGEAGALNYWAKKYPLPKAVSQHNNYYLWGYDNITNSSTVIIMGQSQEELEATFDRVEFVRQLDLKFAIPYEANQSIYLCSGLKGSIEKAWARGKNFN